jgi:organic hydroperoxide reductase OsmC/OhrA/uncharacterized damage-inducible protein DinB
MEVNSVMQQVDKHRTTSEWVDAYVACVDQVRDAVDGLSIDEIKQRPVEGKWSILEVVCHLTDTDIYHTDRIERILALEKPLLMGVDERPYPERLQFQEQDLDEEIQLMELLRSRTARILRRQPEEAWQRTGVHSEVGLCTVHDMVVKSVRHVQHHLAFVAEKRQLILANRPSAPTGKPPAEYVSTIVWENRGPDFARGKYSREHTWSFDGGVSIAASPSPHVVPAPWSMEQAVDPEEALVASASSCHMLTFLWLASKQGWTVRRYEDHAVGIMTKHWNKVPRVSKITLRPQIEWDMPAPPAPDAIATVHEEAHKQCFIANSIKSRIVIQR